MINIVQRKAAAGAVNLVSDFDDIAINGMKNLSATLKALIFGFHEDKTSGTAVLQGLRVSIDSNAHKISVSSGVAVTKVGVYPFFVNATVVKELTPEEMKGIGDNGKYLVLRPNVKTLGTQEQRLVKTPEGTYEEQSVYSEQALQYFIELVDTPQNDDLTFGIIDSTLKCTEDEDYPILRLSRTLDKVTDFLDTATNDKTSGSLMLRDENGRAKIASPSADEDIANKLYVDDCISNEKTARESADSTFTKRIDDLGITAQQYNGNAATATKLTKARTIKIQDSSGSNTGTGVNFDGSGNAIIKLPATIKANIAGNCSGSSGSCAGNSATATKATKATQDESGNNIKASYASSLAVSGKTVTLKSKSGATLSTITTQDTTYGVATTSANGLMPKEDKNYIDKMKQYFYFGSEDSYLSAKTSGGTKYSFVMVG